MINQYEDHWYWMLWTWNIYCKKIYEASVYRNTATSTFSTCTVTDFCNFLKSSYHWCKSIFIAHIYFLLTMADNHVRAHGWMVVCITCTQRYTGCPRRKGPNFGRVFLRSNYTDITQNTYIQSSMVTEIMAREVWNFNSYYSLIDYQIHIETGRNMWFL